MGAKLLTSLCQTNAWSKEANPIVKEEAQNLAKIIEENVWVLVAHSQYANCDT